MPTCITKLTSGFTADCDNLPIAGLEADVTVLNFEDIDRTLTTLNADKTLITALTMNTGTNGYKWEGFKQSNVAGFETVERDNLPDGFKHRLSGVIYKLSADARKELNALARGARLVIIVERKFKGGATQDCAFEVYGYDSGMELAEGTMVTNENAGTVQLTVETPDGEEEPNVPYLFFDTDYATTKAAVDALTP